MTERAAMEKLGPAARYIANLQRIDRLLKLRNFLDNKRSPAEPVSVLEGADIDYLIDDLGISIIAFLHGTFEDTLRSVARLVTAKAASEELLNEIPLVGKPRSDKFRLGALRKHGEKTVNQLIRESVDAHFDTWTLNSSHDAVRFLKSMKAPSEPFGWLLPYLEKMMK